MIRWQHGTGVALSGATSATPVPCCQRIMPGTHGRLPVPNRRKVGMTSSPHDPYVLGCTHATMLATKGSNPARGSESQKGKLSSDRGLQLDPVKPESIHWLFSRQTQDRPQVQPRNGVERGRPGRAGRAHCSVLRVRALGLRTSAPDGVCSRTDLENSIASASIYESS